MEKEKILQRYRQEGVDEGREEPTVGGERGVRDEDEGMVGGRAPAGEEGRIRDAAGQAGCVVRRVGDGARQ